ncbi:endonuclease/exonuclease/phosphatase family protein [Microbacterium sp. A93]|uniref:endonuclease/exonuclease/phosphatase family protein n=1 Tax=Microbacterium sp. A93 TaxID=3450716 RepID=UPI003F4288C7
MPDRANPDPGTLTITTFNVLHDDQDRTGRALTAAAGLNASAPDLVLLQELPFEHGRSSAYLDTLTAATGLAVAQAAPLTAPRPHTTDRSGLGILHGPSLVLEEAGTLPPVPGFEDYLPVPQGSWAVFAEAPSDPAQPGTAQSGPADQVRQAPGRAVAVVNLHGVWGGDRAYEREQQMLHAVRWAESLRQRLADREPLLVLGGDLNTVPESSVIRYLTGLQPLGSAGTYWVDAWEHAGDGTAGHTTSADSAWFLETARGVGIQRPESVPPRRIDYLFIRDWVYGRRGEPLATRVDLTGTGHTGRHASDHFAVTTEVDTGHHQPTALRTSSATRTLN